MTPRKRSEKRRGFPPNLYESRGYFSWKHPKTGQHFGLGRKKHRAFMEAIEANAQLAPRPSLVERIHRPQVQSLGAWLDEYAKTLQKRKGRAGRPLSANSMRAYTNSIRRARRDFDPEQSIADISTRDIAAALDALDEADKARSAQQYRSHLFDCFRVAMQKGWRQDNPVQVTDRVSVRVKRARLTLEQLMAAYQATELVWLRNAIALALVSGQDRDSCVRAEFKQDIRDGAWWNERTKTGARIVLPLELRLDCFGMSLGDVVAQCRGTGILSRYLIHQTKRAKGAQLGKAINPTMLTRKFAAAIKALSIDWGDKNPPSFHEIRSLSARLYRDEKHVDPQALLGHKSAKMTETYTDGRGEWIRVGIAK